ncbi:PIR protein, putative [Plasmodium sp.]|nr:PIR protein, putative [Plasmodium sp.]
MRVHYINILMFALPVHILEHNNSKTFVTQRHRPTTRLLWECELYAPQNYDNDPEMKAIMENFGRETSQRFHEYNERLQENRKKCKEQCDEYIQKIILKDKLEKQMEEHFSALEANIDTNDIPKCVCEKSLEEKMEKRCLRCTQNLGGIVAPSSGVLGGIGEFGLSVWKPAALAAAKEFAEKAGEAKGLAAGIKVGMNDVISGLGSELSVSILDGKPLATFINAQNFKDAPFIFEAVYKQYKATCMPSGPLAVPGTRQPICSSVLSKSLDGGSYIQHNVSMETVIKSSVEDMVSQAQITAGMTAEEATKDAIATLTIEKTGVVKATYMGYQITIIASIVALLVIVLVMMIIYLILRYRRKKKMKKKLQYIKLLKQ